MTDPNDDIRLLYESTWLSAPDLRGRDVTLTIGKITGAEVVGEGGKKNKKPKILWVEKARDGSDIKPMPLNKTNWGTIKSLYGTGNSIKALIGKRVTLYATTCRGAQGGTVDCVRIRNVKPPEKGKGEETPDLSTPTREPGED